MHFDRVSRVLLSLFTFAAVGVAWQVPAHAAPAKKQCVYNQSGYAAHVMWFEESALSIELPADPRASLRAKAGFKLKKATGITKPVKSQTITLGRESCLDQQAGKNHWAVVTVKGAKVARVAAILAADIGAALGTAGCWVGAAALTVATAGGGAVLGVGCEVVTDMTVGLWFEPGIIPDAKESIGLVVPPVDGRKVILYGTVFDPKFRIGK